jgi:hypothetical protein
MKEQQEYRMDELLRQRLQGAEAPVPAGMWARIQDARQERRPHPLGWAGFGALVLLTAAFAGWMTLHQSDAFETSPDLLPHHETAMIAPGQTAATAAQDPAADAFDTKVSSVNDPAINLRDITTYSATDKSPESTPGLQASRRHGHAGAARSPGGAAANARAAQSQTDGKDGNVLKNEQAGLASQPVPATEMPALFASATPLTRLHGRAQPNPVSEQSLFDLSAPQLSILLKKNGPTCYSFNSFLRGLSVDLYLAPEYASRQLVYKNPGMIDYAERRNATEAYSFAFSAGFRANAHFEGGLALRTGLIYTDIVEKFTYTDPNAEVRRVITVSIDTIYNPPDVIIMVDTLSIVEYGNYDKVGYNSYRFYDVPLILGYEIDRGRWIMSLNTGVMLNVATTRRGNMLDPSSNLVSINSSRSDSYPAFRKKVGTSLLMSLGVNYAIRPKLHLLLEPQLRVWMRPLNLKDYPVDQKYVNMGLAMGFRQYF